MANLVNEASPILSNEKLGPHLHLMTIYAPTIASSLKPGQFVHMRIPGHKEHILRRPFSVFKCSQDEGALEILYQEVGAITRVMPLLQHDTVELIGPVGTCWNTSCSHALLVGGGVGAAPLYMLAETLHARQICFDLILGASTKDALVTREYYSNLLGREPYCSTDDGSFGREGFCTSLVEERLQLGCSIHTAPYDFLAVCGPEPLMRIVAQMSREARIPTQVSLEKRMACGIGACLSCVVDTIEGKQRVCVDGPIFEAEKVVW